MKKFKIISIIYFSLAFLFTGIDSYLDFHNLNSGTKFHQLSSIERNASRVIAVFGLSLNPASLLTSPFIGDHKFRKRKTFKYSILMFISIIPSYLFYVWFFGKWNRLKEAIGIKENKNASIEVS